MKKLKHLGRGAVFCAGILVCAGTSQAGVTACGSGSTANLNSIIQSGAAGNTPAQGCGLNDLGFNAFVVTRETGSANTNGPSAGTIDPSTTGSTFTGGTTMGNIGLALGAASAIYTSGATSAFTAHEVNEAISYAVTPNLGGSGEEPPSPNDWALTGVTALGITGAAISGTGIPTGSNAPSITITEEVCIGQKSISGCGTSNEATVTLKVTYSGTGTTLNAAVTSASCGTVSASLGCALLGANGVNGISFDPTLSLAILDTVNITAPVDSTTGDTYTFDFDSFTGEYAQSEIGPEPSTFLLLGSALVGLSVIRFRKRKHA